MGKGRKPKPPALRLLTGRRSTYGLSKNPPMPQSETPPTPDTLHGVALDQWNLLAPALSAAKVLTAIDANVLEAACIAFATWREAQAELFKRGRTQIGKGEVEVKSPWVTISHEALADYLKCSAVLGLSPADRARLQVPAGNKQVDEFEAFQQQA